ncbi:MAG: hypothetical protein JO097_21405 [Acidobacteriaceae bacterium]|nr:hypothetical protein [Acidobacteriaceae bacterium]MBV9763655.1 hypothetical protein [Acidobacteriaceae bacterium]
MTRFLLVLALTTPLALLAQTSENNPFVGTWKLNVAKSKFEPGPPMKSETVTIAADGKVSVDAVEATGQPETWSYSSSAGAAATITGIPDSSVIEKRSGNTIEHTWKLAGGNFRGKGVLSEHGNVMRYTMDGTDSEGRHEHDVLIFERTAASSAPAMQDSLAGAGVWKLNVSKSEFTPGPPPTSATVTIGKDRKISVEEERTDGQKTNYSFTPSEGVAVPITGMENSTLLEKRIDPHTVEHTWNMNGMALNGRGVISDDGKTMTYTLTGTTPDGTAIHNVEIYEKQ